MDYKWQIMQCNKCNEPFAMPLPSLHKIYSSCDSTYMCPYCRSEQLIYTSKRDKMISNKGIGNCNEETTNHDIRGYQE